MVYYHRLFLSLHILLLCSLPDLYTAEKPGYNKLLFPIPQDLTSPDKIVLLPQRRTFYQNIESATLWMKLIVSDCIYVLAAVISKVNQIE